MDWFKRLRKYIMEPTPVEPTVLPDYMQVSPVVDPRSSRDYVPKHPWGKRSKEVLATLDDDLILFCNCMADIMNLSLIWGYRDEEQQTEYYLRGIGLPWPSSYHNQLPSKAVDMIPYPTGYNDLEVIDEMRGAAMAVQVYENLDITNGKHFSNVVDPTHFQTER